MIPGLRSETWGTRLGVGGDVIPGLKSETWGTRLGVGGDVIPGLKSETWGTRRVLMNGSGKADTLREDRQRSKYNDWL